MSTDCQRWIEQLNSENEARNAAIEELRELILQRLQKAFADRPDFGSNFLEDIAQDALMKILQNLAAFESRSKFTTWATTIAIRTAYSELRKKRWKDVSLEQVLSHADKSESLAVKDESTSTNELANLSAILHEAIEQELTPKQREALLAELHGMPLQEIARQTNSNSNAIYKLTHDARKRLKASLEKKGYTSNEWNSFRT